MPVENVEKLETWEGKIHEKPPSTEMAADPAQCASLVCLLSKSRSRCSAETVCLPFHNCCYY